MYELIRMQFSKLTHKHIIDKTYGSFKDSLLERQLYFFPYGMPVHIQIGPSNNLFQEKEELYWHFVSFDENKYNDYRKQLYPPCTNTEYVTLCSDCQNPQPTFLIISNKKRVFCPFRSAYVHAVAELIDQCNLLFGADSEIPAKDPVRNSIKIWHEENRENPRELLVYVIYSRKGTRFVIIMTTYNSRQALKFVTAHPIFEGSLYAIYNEKYQKAKREGRKKLGP